MQLEISDVGPCKKSLEFAMPADKVDKEFEEKFDEVARTIPIPGFRVGRAPHGLIEKKFGEAIAQDVTTKIVRDMFDEAIEKEDWKILGDADFDIPEDPAVRGEEYKFSVIFEVHPEFELGKYVGIEVSDPVEETTAEEVEAAVQETLRMLAKVEDGADGAAATASSLVQCRVSGAVLEDGEEHEFYENDNLSIDLSAPVCPGLGSISELGTAIIGKKVTERGEVAVTLPDDYSVEEWRGGKGTIVFEVLGIKNRQIPALDDELAGKLGFDSVDAWRTHVEEQIVLGKRRKADAEIEQSVIDALVDSHEFDLPQGIIEKSSLAHMQETYGQQYEPAPDDPEWKDSLAKGTKELKVHFLITRIAEEELIVATEADLERKLEAIAQQHGMPLASARQVYEGAGLARELRHDVLVEKTRAFLRSRATVS